MILRKYVSINKLSLYHKRTYTFVSFHLESLTIAQGSGRLNNIQITYADMRAQFKLLASLLLEYYKMIFNIKKILLKMNTNIISILSLNLTNREKTIKKL